MTLRDYLSVTRRRWRIIAITLVVAIGAAVALIVVATPKYSASVQIFVSTPASDSSLASDESGDQFSQSRVKSYSEIANTPAVTTPVISQLHLSMTTQQLGKEISANAPLDTVLLNVSVLDSNPLRAANIANAVGDQMVTLVAQLETPATGGASPVRLSVVRRALVPTSAVSPDKKLYLALGLLVGLVGGVGAGLLRERLDTSLKSTAEVDAVLHSSTLAVVAYDADTAAHPLVVQYAPRSAHAESFRQMRTNLQFVNVDERRRSLVVTSSVAGEGKSVTAANLALVHAEAGYHVLLVDGDLRKPKVASYLGIEGTIGLTTVLARQVELDTAIQNWGNGRLSVLPAGALPPNPSELLGSRQMSVLLDTLERRFDMVVIDSPPLLPVTDAAVLAAIADGALLVVRHSSTRRDAVARAAESLRNVDAALLGAVLNMAPAKGPDAYYYSTYYGQGQGPDQPAPQTRPARSHRADRPPVIRPALPVNPAGPGSPGLNEVPAAPTVPTVPTVPTATYYNPQSR